MGLTGIILDAKIQLKKFNQNIFTNRRSKTKNLKETFEAFENIKMFLTLCLD